jgi:hypothetical protein
MASSSPICDQIQFRVLAVRPESNELLALLLSDRFVLPRISILPHTRTAPQIQAAMLQTWGVDVLTIHGPEESDCPISSVTVRVLKAPEDRGLTWITLPQLAEAEVTETERERLELLFSKAAHSSLLRQIHWIDSTIAWVECECGSSLSQTQQIEQKSFGSSTALLRFSLEDRSECWLKAAKAEEFLATTLLASIAPASLPQVLSAKPEWNAWLMPGGGTPLSKCPGEVHSHLASAMFAMIQLQKAAQDHVQDFLDLGACDHRLQTLSVLLPALFDYLEATMERQTSTKSPRLSRNRIREIRDTVARCIDKLVEFKLPETVLHGDLNGGNILQGGDGCRFIDWCETYVGIPQISIEHLLLLNDAPNREKATVETLLRRASRDLWADKVDPKILEEAELYTPLLAMVSAVHGRADWLRKPSACFSGSGAFVRSLTRCMSRAAQELTDKGALCQ